MAEYLEIDFPHVEDQLYFKNYREFEKAMDAMNPGLKYTWSGKTGRVVGFIYEHVMYCFTIPKLFPSIEEYLEAEREGFEGDYKEWLSIKEEMEKGGYASYRDLEKERGDLTREEWIVLKKVGFKDCEEIHEAEEMGFIYLGQRVFGHKEEHPPTWWGNFTADMLNGFREARKGGFKSRTEFMKAGSRPQ